MPLYRLRRRRSLESSRCCLLYLGRRRLHRLPGARRLRLRRRPVRGRRRHRLRCRRGWCKFSSRARKHTFLCNWYPGLQHSVQRLQCRPFIALKAGTAPLQVRTRAADDLGVAAASWPTPSTSDPQISPTRPQPRPKASPSISNCCAPHSYNAREARVLRTPRTRRSLVRPPRQPTQIAQRSSPRARASRVAQRSTCACVAQRCALCGRAPLDRGRARVGRNIAADHT